MLDEKKRTELEDLIAAWIGEVGQLNQAIQALPGDFKAAVDASGVALDTANQRLIGAILALQGEGAKNVKNMESISTQTTQVIKSYVSEFNEIAAHMRASLGEVRRMNKGIYTDGELFRRQIIEINDLTQKSHTEIDRLRHLVNQNITNFEASTNDIKEAASEMKSAVESINSFDTSKIGAHFGALVVIGGVAALAVGFLLGYLVKSIF